MKPITIERGPQHGAPPSLENVAIDRLQVDPAYQRATDGPQSRRIISGMVKRWDWTLCQPLVVARRADGGLWVLDGQHRLAGARARGDILFLHCVILPSEAVGAEANTFLELNTRRQKLSEADKFNAMLAAGDKNATAVAGLLEATGWRIRKSSNSAIFEPGDLVCAPMLVRARAVHGNAAIELALLVLRKAYPDTAVRPAATMLQALIDLVAGEEHLDAAALAKMLAAKSPSQWIALRDAHAAAKQTTRTTAALIVLRQHMKLGALASAAATPTQMPTTKALPCVVPPSNPRSVRSSLFGASGKGWCEQCQELVSEGRAKGCRDKFCKLQAAA